MEDESTEITAGTIILSAQPVKEPKPGIFIRALIPKGKSKKKTTGFSNNKPIVKEENIDDALSEFD